jgi:hypothetical protein
METLSPKWLSTLTVGERAAWNEYAQQRGSAKGDDRQIARGNIVPAMGKLMTGKNAYIGCNVLLARTGQAAITAAPLGTVIPGNPTGLTVAFVPGGAGSFTITWTDSVSMGASDLVALWGVCPGTFHKQFIGYFAKTVETTFVTYMRGANGINLDLVVGLYKFQAVTVDTKGQRSAGGVVKEYNVTSLT